MKALPYIYFYLLAELKVIMDASEGTIGYNTVVYSSMRGESI